MKKTYKVAGLLAISLFTLTNTALAESQYEDNTNNGSLSATPQCVQLPTNLHIGMSDDANQYISALQTALAHYPQYYPSAQVTGYFGPLTQTALQAYQQANRIVTSGSWDTTGYGNVGTRTSAALFNDCNAGYPAKSTSIDTGFYTSNTVTPTETTAQTQAPSNLAPGLTVIKNDCSVAAVSPIGTYQPQFRVQGDCQVTVGWSIAGASNTDAQPHTEIDVKVEKWGQGPNYVPQLYYYTVPREGINTYTARTNSGVRTINVARNTNEEGVGSVFSVAYIIELYNYDNTGAKRLVDSKRVVVGPIFPRHGHVSATTCDATGDGTCPVTVSWDINYFNSNHPDTVEAVEIYDASDPSQYSPPLTKLKANNTPHGSQVVNLKKGKYSLVLLFGYDYFGPNSQYDPLHKGPAASIVLDKVPLEVGQADGSNALMQGTIRATDCVMASNAETCPISINWNSTGTNSVDIEVKDQYRRPAQKILTNVGPNGSYQFTPPDKLASPREVQSYIFEPYAFKMTDHATGKFLSSASGYEIKKNDSLLDASMMSVTVNQTVNNVSNLVTSPATTTQITSTTNPPWANSLINATNISSSSTNAGFIRPGAMTTPANTIQTSLYPTAGTLTASTCTVASGAQTCPVTFTWTSSGTNYNGLPNVTVRVIDKSTLTYYGGSLVSGRNSVQSQAASGSSSFALPAGNYSMQLIGYNASDPRNVDGWVTLSSQAITVSPAPSTTPTTGTLFTMPCTIVMGAQTCSVTFSWTSSGTNFGGLPNITVRVIDNATRTYYGGSLVANRSYIQSQSALGSGSFALPAGSYSLQLIGYNSADTRNTGGWVSLDSKSVSLTAPVQATPIAPATNSVGGSDGGSAGGDCTSSPDACDGGGGGAAAALALDGLIRVLNTLQSYLETLRQ